MGRTWRQKFCPSATIQWPSILSCANDIEELHRIGQKIHLNPATTRNHSLPIRKDTRPGVSVNIIAQTKERITEQGLNIFINEDLTTLRSKPACKTRVLKKPNKISNCWTHNGDQRRQQHGSQDKRCDQRRQQHGSQDKRCDQ